MTYIVTIILSVVSAVLAYLLQSVIKDNKELRDTKKSKEHDRQDAITGGVLSLLRIQLIEYHDKYMTRDNIPLYIFENWDDMFNSYKALGGNGAIKKMNDDISKLRLGGEKHEKAD